MGARPAPPLARIEGERGVGSGRPAATGFPVLRTYPAPDPLSSPVARWGRYGVLGLSLVLTLDGLWALSSGSGPAGASIPVVDIGPLVGVVLAAFVLSVLVLGVRWAHRVRWAGPVPRLLAWFSLIYSGGVLASTLVLAFGDTGSLPLPSWAWIFVAGVIGCTVAVLSASVPFEEDAPFPVLGMLVTGTPAVLAYVIAIVSAPVVLAPGILLAVLLVAAVLFEWGARALREPGRIPLPGRTPFVAPRGEAAASLAPGTRAPPVRASPPFRPPASVPAHPGPASLVRTSAGGPALSEDPRERMLREWEERLRLVQKGLDARKLELDTAARQLGLREAELTRKERGLASVTAYGPALPSIRQESAPVLSEPGGGRPAAPSALLPQRMPLESRPPAPFSPVPRPSPVPALASAPAPYPRQVPPDREPQRPAYSTSSRVAPSPLVPGFPSRVPSPPQSAPLSTGVRPITVGAPKARALPAAESLPSRPPLSPEEAYPADRVGSPSVVCVIAESPDASTPVLQGFVLDGLAEGEDAIVVTLASPVDHIAQRLSGADPRTADHIRAGRLQWIDGRAANARRPSGLGTTGAEIDHSSPTWARTLGQFLATLRRVAGAENAGFRVAVFGVSAALERADYRVGFAFLRNVVGLVRSRGGIVLFELEDGPPTQLDLEEVTERADRVLRVRMEKGRVILAGPGSSDSTTVKDGYPGP